jgi:hypothetical protein
LSAISEEGRLSAIQRGGNASACKLRESLPQVEPLSAQAKKMLEKQPTYSPFLSLLIINDIVIKTRYKKMFN